MRKALFFRLLPLFVLLIISSALTAANAGVVKVRFISQGDLFAVDRSVPAGMQPVETAVRELVAGPTPVEAAAGITTNIPAGTIINKLTIKDTSVEVDFSMRVLVGLDEANLLGIFDQFRSTLADFPDISSIKLTCNGNLLSTYLPAPPTVGGPAKITASAVLPAVTGLSGRSITIGPSHGRYWNGSAWYWQRSDPCGFGEAVLEDTNSIRLAQYLAYYLQADGARVESCRQMDESDTSTSPAGVPWWKMSATSWMRHLGLSCSIWASSTGNCGDDTATNRYNDDIRCRPLYADYKGTDIYLACHTNATGLANSTVSGTETYHDSAMEHPAWVNSSTTLATQVQTNLVSAIRDMYDSSWSDRGVKEANGAYGEIRIPDRPACLIELAFHDNCSKDVPYLTDDFFRSVAEWGFYKGICGYFGATPTWDKYSCEYVSDTIPANMTIGQSYNVSITLRNRGVCWLTARGFRLGVPNGTDPFTGLTRINITGLVKPGQTYTYNFIMAAPNVQGTYTTKWQMVRDGYQWFGPTLNKQVYVTGGTPEPPDNTGTVLPAKTFDWQYGVPTWMSSGWASSISCGYTAWYSYTETATDCANFNRSAKWLSNQSYAGRGHWATDVQVPCRNASVNALYRLVKPDGTDEGTSVWLDQCPKDGWYTLLDADKQDLSIGGWRIHTADTAASPSGSCGTACGSKALGAAGLRMYGDRWQYINDWTCLGGYASGGVDNIHGFLESSAYLYPAVDRTHGNVFTLGAKTAGRVSTGDCNYANTLDFKGNAGAFGGGDNMDSYAFAWVYAPAGASPKLVIGSDDGNRVWVNGTLVNDNNAARSLTRDQDETAAVSLPAGWSRVLFKVHNTTGSFQGTVSLRSGSDKKWNEPSVDVFNMGDYLSYGIGCEQDSWYPRIDVAVFNGLNDPQRGAQVFTNNTTVTASGRGWVVGPVPFWKVMHFERGYGLNGDTNYLNTSVSSANWSHTQTGVTGHRRFHFFAVSNSRRTSFQSGPDSGAVGGSNWDDGGPGNYMDVFVDNVAPNAPVFSEITASSANQIALDWDIPLDNGVGAAPGADEYASVDGDNGYRRGDVGVSVRRNGAVISTWSTAASFSDTGLTANTAYTYDIAARDNNSLSRGNWSNATSYAGNVTRWTLSAPPSASNITCDRTTRTWYDTPGFTFTSVDGFGAGKVDHYLYAWDNRPTHTFNGSESSWNSGTLALTASAEGEWYLHVQGFNGEGVPNGTLDLGPYRYSTAEIVEKIGLAWAQPDSKSIALKNKAVTAAMPGMFYLEESDRSAAIKVLSGTPVSRGDMVSAAGILGISGTQRAMFADIVDVLGTANMPAPISMMSRGIGGASINSQTPGITSGTGAYNIGLLVRICGSVTYANTDNQNEKYCYLNDGGGFTDGVYSGIRVICGSVNPPASGWAIVTGIVSSEQIGGRIVPTLIIRDSNDIKLL